MIVSIHQLLPNLSYGDATSTQAVEIRNYLRRKGFRSEIFAQGIGERMELEANRLDEKLPEPGSVLIYHHAIGSDLVKFLEKHDGIKGVIYHNITPSRYFRRYNPLLSELTELGRNQLSVLKDFVQLAYGVSEYNCRELKDAGLEDPQILPIIVDPEKWDIPSDQTVKETYGGDDRTNILFVGRISPNKCQKELVQMQFYLKQVMPNSRLLIVGKYDQNDLYYQEIRREIYRLGLENDVVLSGHVSMKELKSYYEVSDLFLSFSEHEGFGVPLIEAMWFNLPVLAYKSSAIPETLGDAGILFTEKGDLEKVAVLVKVILQNQEIRDPLLDAERKRRNMFVPEKIHPVLGEMLERIDNLSEKEDAGKSVKEKRKPRVAFVIQRYGQEINGGAETLCRAIAERMATHWDIDVLTTCASDYLTWENHLERGISLGKKVLVRRFKVDHPRDLEKFSRLSNILTAKGLDKCTIEEQEEWMKAQGPYSTELLSYIASNSDRYDLFIFFTYLYATTYFGLSAAGQKACLVPTVHDEWPIYLPIFQKMFSKPESFIFNTPEERDFLRRKFPELTLDGPISGVGINKPSNIEPERFRDLFKISEPFILYLGRIDSEKGCDILFNYFLKFKNEHPSSLKLILAGKSTINIPDHPDIIQLGFVDEKTKWDTMAACRVLVNPSLYESLSMVLLEAWSIGKPVLVNGNCEVLKNQTERAKGGRVFYDHDTFSFALLDLLGEKQYMKEAEEFVNKNYNWEKIEKDYLEMADNFLQRSERKS